MPTPEQTLIQAAIRGHTGAWFESGHAKIFGKDRNAGLMVPKMNYLQTKVQRAITKFDLLDAPIRLVILKPRQKGATTYCCAIDYTVLRRDSASAVIIGGQYSQVAEALGMLQTYSKNDTFDWGNRGEINTKAGAWSHGSKLITETANDARAGIGGTHQVLHCFEVARWVRHGVANSSEVLANITKCVPLLPRTVIILESTAEGQSGAFYERWLPAIDVEKFLDDEVKVTPGSYVRCFAAWFQFDDSAMRLTEEEQEEVKNSLDEDAEYYGEKALIEAYGVVGEDGVMRLGETVKDFSAYEQLFWRRWSIREECDRDVNKFNRDYPDSWQNAFQKSGSQRFNTAGLMVMRKRLSAVTPQHGIIEEHKRRVAFRQTPLNEAKVSIFEKPIRGCRYLLSLDPMTGISQVAGADPDYHGAFVMRAGYYDVKGEWKRPAAVACVVQCRFDIDVLEEIIWRLARFYGNVNGCLIAIEMNAERGVTELLKQRGANLYMREQFNQREQRTTKALGYMTNVKTREVLVETLAAAIREYDTSGHGVDIWDSTAMSECDNFVSKDNGRSEAAEGHHDDQVIAIALGLELIGHATVYVGEQSIFGIPPELRDEAQGTRRTPSAYS